MFAKTGSIMPMRLESESAVIMTPGLAVLATPLCHEEDRNPGNKGEKHAKEGEKVGLREIVQR